MMTEDQIDPNKIFLLAKMSDGSRYKLPVKKLLAIIAKSYLKYYNEEGNPITKEKAWDIACDDLFNSYDARAALSDEMTRDGVSEWSDWEDVAERLPDHRLKPEDMWADSEIELIQQKNEPQEDQSHG